MTGWGSLSGSCEGAWGERPHGHAEQQVVKAKVVKVLEGGQEARWGWSQELETKAGALGMGNTLVPIRQKVFLCPPAGRVFSTV